jgi:DNA N-6-adenine-methyltransferase (Dam)
VSTSALEHQRLTDLESIIERRLTEVGAALAEIRDERLYRETHATFEDYCRERWQMSKTHANRKIQAAAVMRALAPIGVTPTNEAQARELAPLLNDEANMAGTWAEVVSLNPSPTAADVRAAVNRRTVQAMTSSESFEWYTPPRYIDLARQLMGRIDLDPASNPLANNVVQAERFFTEDRDGLNGEWRGRVWLNPPYGNRCPLFVAKLQDEYESGRVTEAILLVNAYSTETRWFQPLLRRPICFTDHRINFYRPSGTASSGATHGSAFVYFGAREREFIATFRTLGAITVPPLGEAA